MTTPLSPSIFEFRDYRKYLDDRLPTSGPQRGLRTKLAEAVRCQTAFVSQVIYGQANFGFEQAVLINRFLEHTEVESDFFLLLVHLAKAGSKDLEIYYEKKIQQILDKRQSIAERIQVKDSLSAEDQMRYYSAWYYSAIHILVTVPGLRTPQALVTHLKLPIALISEALDFLVSIGLVTFDSSEYRIGSQSIHLKKASPMISKHHANWRMRAIAALENPSNDDLFFSGPISLSKADAKKLKESILKFLEQNQPMIARSKEEEVHCLSFDFFKI